MFFSIEVWHTVVAKVDDIWESAQARAVGAFVPLPFKDAEVSEVVGTPVKLVQEDGEPTSRHEPRSAAPRSVFNGRILIS